eukprot:scaffold221528_cov50-Prasinocladus_malaysianus.AAC.1
MSVAMRSSALSARVASSRPARAGRASRLQCRAGNARVARSSKDDVIVSPSILSANFSTLGAE